MPFDEAKWGALAKQHQVGSVALDAALALIQVRRALEKIASQANVDISPELEKLRAQQRELHQYFKEMTGYTDDDDGG